MLGLLFTIGCLVAAPTAKAESWTTLQEVPHNGIGVQGMIAGVVGDKIIAALGLDLVDTATTRIYDISSNTWSLGSDAPGASSEGAGIVKGGLFYALGGRSVGTTRNDLWSYDPASDVWTVLAPMTVARTGLAVAEVGGFIYAIGGRQQTRGPCSGSPLAAVEKYNIATDSWTAVAPLPSARSDLAAMAVGGKIYVFGGCSGSPGQLLEDVDVYDPRTDRWSQAPEDLPAPRASFYSVGKKGDTIFVIGGIGLFFTETDVNEAYKVASDSWHTGTVMPNSRAEASAVSHGGRIYVLGGATPAFGSSVAFNEVYKP